MRGEKLCFLPHQSRFASQLPPLGEALGGRLIAAPTGEIPPSEEGGAPKGRRERTVSPPVALRRQPPRQRGLWRAIRESPLRGRDGGRLIAAPTICHSEEGEARRGNPYPREKENGLPRAQSALAMTERGRRGIAGDS